MTGLISGNDRQTLTELIRAIIREERKKEKAVRGNGGNTVIVSDGDILLRTMGTHKAYYNGTEIGTGAGSITGSGTANYIPKFTGAGAIGNSGLSEVSGALVYDAVAPGLAFDVSGVSKSDFYFSTNTTLRSHDSNLHLIALDITKSIINKIGTVAKLTIANTQITAAVPAFVLDEVAPGYILSNSGIEKSYFYFSTDTILRSLDTNLILRAQDVTKSILHRIGTVDKLIINDTQIISSTNIYTNAKSIYVFDGDPNGAGTSRLGLTYLGNDGRVIGTNGYLKLAGASGIIAEDVIAMSSNKITGLAEGTVAGDAVRYEQIAGTTNYLPKYSSAGVLGNSSLKEITSDIIFAKHLKSNAKKIYLYDGDPEGAGTTRLTLGYTGNDGQLIGTNGNLKLSAVTNVIMDGNKLVFQVNQAGTATSITDDATGVLVLNTVGKLKVVVT